MKNTEKYKSDPSIFDKLPEDAILMDGYDDCILGIAERCGYKDIVAYDLDKILEKLVKQDGMTMEEAYEFYSFNMVGSWVGQHTPLFVRKLP